MKKLFKKKKPASVREAIFLCYILMVEYLESDGVEDENCFCCMCSEIESYKAYMPYSAYERISNFINETLSPIVYDYEKTFAECFTDEIGFVNDKGFWQTHNEECTYKLCSIFVSRLEEISQQTDHLIEQLFLLYSA